MISLAIGFTVSTITIVGPILWLLGGTIGVVGIHFAKKKIFKDKHSKEIK